MRFDRVLIWKALVAVAIAALSANLMAAQIVTDGLVSFWSLDASTIGGAVVNDVWGNNHGTMIGNPEAVDGKINEALMFNGESTLIEIEHSESLNLEDAITMEFWFLLVGDSINNEYPRLVSKGQSTDANEGYGMWARDTRNPTDIGFRSVTLTPNDIRSQAVPNYNDDAWHHVALTYDGENGRLYFDGVVLVDIPVSGGISQVDDPLHIGDGNDERHFSGAIDEVRIYDRALDEDEILENFDAKSNSLGVDAKSKLATLLGRLKVQ